MVTVVRVVGLKQYKDRHGKDRRYHRKSGTPIDPKLKGTALAAEVDRLDRLYAAMQPVAGTLRSLIVAYKEKSAHWAGLRERTRKDYERVFKWLGTAMDSPLVQYKTPIVVALRDKAHKRHGFKFANQVLITLKMVFAFGVEYDHVKVNPVVDVSAIQRPADLPDANLPWEPLEAIKFVDGLPWHLKGPTALAAYLALREGDIVAVSRAALPGWVLDIVTSKTRRRLELPICDDLAEILAGYAEWRAGLFKKLNRSDNVVQLFVNSRGQPWTLDGFKTSFGKARDSAVTAGEVTPGSTFHGLRTTVATILADEEFDASQTKHLLGHGAETMTEHYQRRAKRRKLLEAMTDRVQQVYRNAKNPNVIPIESRTDLTNRRS